MANRARSRVEKEARAIERDLRLMADIDVGDIEDALHDAGEIMVDGMERRVPVRTGELRESITKETGRVSSSGARVIVGFDDDGWYAHLVELGTVHMPPEPFMRPAFDKNVDRMVEAIADRLNAEIQ